MDTDEKSLESFSSVYRITPNPNTNAGLSLAELMFTRKIRSVFDRILPSTTKTTATRENLSTRFYKPGDKILFLNYRTGKSFWEEGIIMKRIGHMLYSVNGVEEKKPYLTFQFPLLFNVPVVLLSEDSMSCLCTLCYGCMGWNIQFLVMLYYKIINREEHWKRRCLKEAAYMLSNVDVLSRPNIEMNTISEPITEKAKSNCFLN